MGRPSRSQDERDDEDDGEGGETGTGSETGSTSEDEYGHEGRGARAHRRVRGDGVGGEREGGLISTPTATDRALMYFRDADDKPNQSRGQAADVTPGRGAAMPWSSPGFAAVLRPSISLHPYANSPAAPAGGGVRGGTSTRSDGRTSTPSTAAQRHRRTLVNQISGGAAAPSGRGVGPVGHSPMQSNGGVEGRGRDEARATDASRPLTIEEFDDAIDDSRELEAAGLAAHLLQQMQSPLSRGMDWRSYVYPRPPILLSVSCLAA